MQKKATPSEKEARVRRAPHPLLRVLALARELRGPDGCPWDREQTVESLTPYLQEETYEVVEAVSARDPGAFSEELGDLLFLVALFAVVGEETGWTSLDEIAQGVVDKLIRRHPHVFAGTEPLETDGALRQWEELKKAEKGRDPEGETPSALGRRPVGLPALTAAYRISEKAAAVGFQWPSIDGALRKLEEEVIELHREIETSGPPEDLERELGDVLYSVVNLSRYLQIDPERALRSTTRKFIRRFQHVETRLAEGGTTPERATLEEMDRLWDEAKERGIS